MTAADTGWINDENPAEVASRVAEEHRFQAPIDEVYLSVSSAALGGSPLMASAKVALSLLTRPTGSTGTT